MNSVVLLTKLQLMQTLGGVRSAIEKRAGANGAMAGTAIVGIFVFAGVAWLGYSAYGAVGAMGLDKVVFDMLFLACGVLTFVLSLPAILSTFFGASDINDLLPLPVSPFAIAFSKSLSALATSYLYTFLLIAAPLAGWGVAAGATAGYWLAYALAILLTPMMPVAYAGTVYKNGYISNGYLFADEQVLQSYAGITFAGFDLNVWNSFCVRDLNEAGFKSLILSSELSGREIRELLLKNHDRNIDLEMIVNGNLEVIVSKDDFTNLNDGKDFIISNDADYATLEDKKRKKFKYKIFFDYNRQSHIINKDCLCLIEEINEIKEFGLDSLILDCRYSNEKYTSQILSIYNESLQNKDQEELTKYKYEIMDFSQSYINKGNYIEGRLHENS